MTETPTDTTLSGAESPADGLSTHADGDTAPYLLRGGTERPAIAWSGTRLEPSVTPWPSESSGCSEPKSNG